MLLLVAERQRPLAAARREANVGGVNFGSPHALAERHAATLAGQAPPRGLVEVHDGGSMRPEVLEQSRLGREILLHRAMVIEMVASEVREHRDVVLQPL